jgi:hypothetical protein
MSEFHSVLVTSSVEFSSSVSNGCWRDTQARTYGTLVISFRDGGAHDWSTGQRVQKMIVEGDTRHEWSAERLLIQGESSLSHRLIDYRCVFKKSVDVKGKVCATG